MPLTVTVCDSELFCHQQSFVVGSGPLPNWTEPKTIKDILLFVAAAAATISSVC